MERTGAVTEVYLAGPEQGKRHRGCPAGMWESQRVGGGMGALRNEGARLLRAREIRESRAVCVMCSKFLKVKTA